MTNTKKCPKEIPKRHVTDGVNWFTEKQNWQISRDRVIGIEIELEHDMRIILLFCFANCTLIASHSHENKKCMGENQVKWQRSGGGGGKWLKGLTSFHHVPSVFETTLCKKLYNFLFDGTKAMSLL